MRTRILLEHLLAALVAVVFFTVPAAAAPFTQCPAGTTGTDVTNTPWTSCAYLLTINPDNSVTVQADTALLTSIFNDKIDPEDILIGVQNSSGRTQLGIHLQGATDAEFFAFDFDLTGVPDFPYTGAGNISFPGHATSFGGGGNTQQIVVDADCVLLSDPNCFGPSGNVNFIGGLADGQSTWFGLEGASQVDGSPISIAATVVSEPRSISLVGLGFAVLFLTRRRRARGDEVRCRVMGI